MNELKEKLEAAGFSFHFGEPGFPDKDLVGKHWPCWTGPCGHWDVESGEACDTEEQAVFGALDMLIQAAIDLDNA